MPSRPLPKIIPVLPLPNLVFFPGTHVSLHIPRPLYDRMGLGPGPEDSCLGIVLWRSDSSDTVAHHPIGCAGHITRSHNLPCGRLVHLGLYGIRRFLICEGWFEKGVGTARIEPIDENPDRLHPRRKERLIHVLREFGPLSLMAPETEQYLTQALDDESFVNQMCLESGLSPYEKYFLLEAEGLNQRSGRLADLLRFRGDDTRARLDTRQKDR